MKTLWIRYIKYTCSGKNLPKPIETHINAALFSNHSPHLHTPSSSSSNCLLSSATKQVRVTSSPKCWAGHLADVDIGQGEIHPQLVATHLQHGVQAARAPARQKIRGFHPSKISTNYSCFTHEEIVRLISLAPLLLTLEIKIMSLKRKRQRSFLIQM